MGVQFGMLTYRGEVEAEVGKLHGWDETFRPYMITEVQVYREGDPALPEDTWEGEEFCGMCEKPHTHTHVHISLADPETVKAQLPAYALAARLRGLL